MRILVTGSSGFIGGHLVELLSERNEVVALARTLPAAPLDGVEWVVQDLATELDTARLPQQVDAVVHLAQSRRYREFPGGARDVFEVNVGGTHRLLEYARIAGARAFIFASTGGIYGYSYEKLVETAPISPLGFYFTSKYAAELLVGSYQEFFRTVVFRFFFVYGPGQTGMLVPRLLERVTAGESIPVEGNPGLRINPIHVHDAVRIFEPALALERSDVFNVAGDEVVAIEELVAVMERVAGRDASIERVEARREGDLIGDNTRMKHVLGVEPAITLERGLAALVGARVP
jgi:nucleoside-diphosphate-sugar epimerase